MESFCEVETDVVAAFKFSVREKLRKHPVLIVVNRPCCHLPQGDLSGIAFRSVFIENKIVTPLGLLIGVYFGFLEFLSIEYPAM